MGFCVTSGRDTSVEEKSIFVLIWAATESLQCEAAMPALEAWLHKRSGSGNVKRNCKLSVEQSGTDNLQFAETDRLQKYGAWHF